MAQQDPGIIIVVSDQPRTSPEDEVLNELARLPKFSPLVLPETPSTFSLANVFGTLAIQDSSSSAYSAGWSSLTGSGSGSGSGTGSVFDADLLADILIQYQAHTKACFQEIQERQRILGTKIRQLDSVATQALQDLLAVQYQTRAHVDQLHFVHSLARQTETMSKLLASTLEKLSSIVVMHSEAGDDLQGSTSTNNNDTSLAGLLPPVDKERYPHLHAFISQPIQPSSSLLPRPSPPTATLISPSPSVAGPLPATLTSTTSPIARSGATSPARDLISSALPATTTTTTHNLNVTSSGAVSSSPGSVLSSSMTFTSPAAKSKPLAATVTCEMLSSPEIKAGHSTTSLNGHSNTPNDGKGSEEESGRQPLSATDDAIQASTTMAPPPTILTTAPTMTTTVDAVDSSTSSTTPTAAAGGGLGMVEGLSGLMAMLTKTINDSASTLAGVGQEIQRHTGGAFTAVRNPLSTSSSTSSTLKATQATSDPLSSSSAMAEDAAQTGTSVSSLPSGLVSEATENLRRLVRSSSQRRPGQQ
ncbi:hypothetical protein BGW42_006375 [Actinomortierella wolfii]|nr:hypothetical protein BGW42_006375 [Actinomortierella wolfii]